MEKIIVTRHSLIVEYLKEQGYVDDDTPIIPHVESTDEIKGKHVFGILPVHMMSEAGMVTVVSLKELPEGTKVTRENYQKFIRKPYTVRVEKTKTWKEA